MSEPARPWTPDAAVENALAAVNDSVNELNDATDHFRDAMRQLSWLDETPRRADYMEHLRSLADRAKALEQEADDLMSGLAADPDILP